MARPRRPPASWSMRLPSSRNRWASATPAVVHCEQAGFVQVDAQTKMAQLAPAGFDPLAAAHEGGQRQEHPSVLRPAPVQVVDGPPLAGVEEQLDQLDHLQGFLPAAHPAGGQVCQRQLGSQGGGVGGEHQGAEAVTYQGVGRKGAIGVAAHQPAQAAGERGAHVGLGPAGQGRAQLLMCPQGEDGPGGHRATEQRHDAHQRPVRG